MAKEKEKSVARLLYVEHQLSQKEIADKVGVQEKTISVWVNENGWKAERDARINGPLKQIENIKSVISSLTEQRLELEEQRKSAKKLKDKELEFDLNKQAVGIADEISKWNKALSNLDKSNKITLEVYLHVMDDIFSALQQEDRALHTLTLDFQERHIQFMSKKLG